MMTRDNVSCIKWVPDTVGVRFRSLKSDQESGGAVLVMMEGDGIKAGEAVELLSELYLIHEG